MPFMMPCPNKGCGEMQSPYIDPKTDKVYCSACDKEIANATYFAKVQMKTLKQYKQHSGKSFSVKCPHCNNNDRPVKKDKSYCCASCNKSLDLPHAFKVTLDAYLSSATKEI